MRFLAVFFMLTIFTIDGWGLEFVVDSVNYSTTGLNTVTVENGIYSGAITIPSSVVYSNNTYTVNAVGAYAFFSCTGLTSINIPSSVTSIGYSAFWGCTSLTSIIIPSSVTNIGVAAFSCCSGLITVDSNNKYYSSEDGVLYNKNQTAILQCPISIIGNFDIPSSVRVIGASAFEGCKGLTSITIPPSVTRIGDDAFNSCSGLTSITIPSSVTRIGARAFYDCTGITSFTIPTSVTSIGDFTFYGFAGLTSIIIPSSVTSIGEFAFYDCTGLTSITIPSSVTSIGDYAFKGCNSLTATNIPPSVTSIGIGAFSGCSGLITVDPQNTTYSSKDGVLYDKKLNTLIHCHITVMGEYYIPSSVKSIGEYAFYGCKGLTSITIPSSVTSIGDYAFYGCKGITSITIPPSVTGIGQVVFSGCTGLTSITIPSSVTYIGESAFEGCTGLTSIAIPSSVEYIGWYAFEGCTGLTSIVIPPLVDYIGESAFKGCTGLTSITIPPSVTNIGDCAFKGCNSLTSITIPSFVTRIGYNAFIGCTGLTSVHSFMALPMNVDFQSVNSSCTLYIPVGTRSLYEAAVGWNYFSNVVEIVVVGSSFDVDGITYTCNGEGTVSIDAKTTYSGTIIPSTVNYWGINFTPDFIENGVFEYYGNFTNIIVPSSIVSIGNYVFNSCANLVAIELPSTLQSIGDYAFNNCTSLSSIKVNATTPPSLGSDVFSLVDKTKCALYVPTGSLSAYKEADQWKDFLTILEFDPAGIPDVNITKLSIYPNPTQTHVNIELGEKSINVQLILLNSLGQKVYECQASNERISFDVSHFPAGMYFVNVKGENNQNFVVGKFIKQ